MISNDKKQEVMARISEIEKATVKHGDEDIAICALCKNITKESAKLVDSSDSLTPILRTGHQLERARNDSQIQSFQKEVSKHNDFIIS